MSMTARVNLASPCLFRVSAPICKWNHVYQGQVHVHDLEFKAVDTFSYLITQGTFQKYRLQKREEKEESKSLSYPSKTETRYGRY